MDEADLMAKVIEALEASKERKFLESVELAINLKDVNLADPKNRINEEITLPHGRGRGVKVAAICTGEMALKAKNSADLVVQVEELDPQHFKGKSEAVQVYKVLGLGLP